MFGSSDQIVAGSGFVVADEPQAAQVGAAILAHGGNAIDAISATYFALAVTYPVAAGLGGGGLCVVHTGRVNSTFDFAAGDASAGGPYAVPGNVSGFSSLQANYGTLPWQRVVSPAESLAAAGFRISQALAGRLAASANVVRLDATLSAEFLNEAGELKPAGTRVASPELAQTLSLIRTRGPQSFYRGGSLANQIAAYSSAQGGAITVADLDSYRPSRATARAMNIAGTMAYLPSISSASGRFAAAVLSHLVDSRGVVAAPASKLVPLVRSVVQAVNATRSGAPLPPDLGTTGFAAVDRNGMAAACGVTMNGPFGTGHTVTPTGVTLANAPKAGAFPDSTTYLTPVIAVSDQQVTFVGTGTGGPEGSAAILLALLQMADGEDIVRPGALIPTGREPQQTVNVIDCRNGTCVAAADPRGFGLGAGGN